jgi:hypothetical protein
MMVIMGDGSTISSEMENAANYTNCSDILVLSHLASYLSIETDTHSVDRQYVYVQSRCLKI